MDGFTVTLTFVAPVTPGAINTLKVGVADVGDSGYDMEQVTYHQMLFDRH